MAQKHRKFDPARETGAENRIDPTARPTDEMTHEVAQRGRATDAHGEGEETTRVSAPNREQTSGFGNREDRENPGMGLQQSGTRQSHELPGEGTRVGRDVRKRISDVGERPSR